MTGSFELGHDLSRTSSGSTYMYMNVTDLMEAIITGMHMCMT